MASIFTSSPPVVYLNRSLSLRLPVDSNSGFVPRTYSILLQERVETNYLCKHGTLVLRTFFLRSSKMFSFLLRYKIFHLAVRLKKFNFCSCSFFVFIFHCHEVNVLYSFIL
jgi:hypothetical protein